MAQRARGSRWLPLGFGPGNVLLMVCGVTRQGIVTATGWDADYNTMAAMVAFGRDYSVGIVFPELSAIQLVAIPEPSSALVLLSGVLLTGAVLSRCGRGKADS